MVEADALPVATPARNGAFLLGCTAPPDTPMLIVATEDGSYAFASPADDPAAADDAAFIAADGSPASVVPSRRHNVGFRVLRCVYRWDGDA